jgi:hypothetical protein
MGTKTSWYSSYNRPLMGRLPFWFSRERAGPLFHKASTSNAKLQGERIQKKQQGERPSETLDSAITAAGPLMALRSLLRKAPALGGRSWPMGSVQKLSPAAGSRLFSAEVSSLQVWSAAARFCSYRIRFPSRFLLLCMMSSR